VRQIRKDKNHRHATQLGYRKEKSGGGKRGEDPDPELGCARVKGEAARLQVRREIIIYPCARVATNERKSNRS
jgi:hypothetical protein